MALRIERQVPRQQKSTQQSPFDRLSQIVYNVTSSENVCAALSGLRVDMIIDHVAGYRSTGLRLARAGRRPARTERAQSSRSLHYFNCYRAGDALPPNPPATSVCDIYA